MHTKESLLPILEDMKKEDNLMTKKQFFFSKSIRVKSEWKKSCAQEKIVLFVFVLRGLKTERERDNSSSHVTKET